MHGCSEFLPSSCRGYDGPLTEASEQRGSAQ